jgi:hypothetical protein
LAAGLRCGFEGACGLDRRRFAGPIPPPIPIPAVWRFRRGGGDVVALPECGCGVEVFCAASQRVYVRHVTPEWELQSNFWLTSVNARGISELGGSSAKNGRFTRSRART